MNKEANDGKTTHAAGRKRAHGGYKGISWDREKVWGVFAEKLIKIYVTGVSDEHVTYLHTGPTV